MTDKSDRLVAEHHEFFAELERVCPEAAGGLAVAGSPPPMLSIRDRIKILRTLPSNAGTEAFLAAWLAFARENPAAVLRRPDT